MKRLQQKEVFHSVQYNYIRNMAILGSIILVAAFIVSSDQSTIPICEACPPGKRVVSPCLADGGQPICEACPENTYRNEPHHEKTCIQCSHSCPITQKLVSECSAVSDIVCACPQGTFWFIYVADEGICKREQNETYETSTGLRCQLCPPGTYLSQHCTQNNGLPVCESCANDTFTAKANNYFKCSDCRACKIQQINKQECSSTADRICECPDGMFWSPYTQGEGICKFHTNCSQYQIIVKKGTPSTDTECQERQPNDDDKKSSEEVIEDQVDSTGNDYSTKESINDDDKKSSGSIGWGPPVLFVIFSLILCYCCLDKRRIVTRLKLLLQNK